MAFATTSMQTDLSEPTFPAPPPSSPPTPPPPPPAPMPSFKEIKMNAPTPFTGDRTKLNDFLMEVEMYMKINEEIYNTDTKKIIFTLSYMKEGTAGPWKHSYWSNAIATNNMGSWDYFKRVLKESFSAFDKPGDAIIKMETEMMTRMTADQYIEQFKIWAAESEVFQDRPLVQWFMKGLNLKLRQNILLSNDPPTTIREWYKTASKFDNHWRRAQALNRQLTGGYNSKKKGLNFKSSPRPYAPDPNAMDMRLDKLSTEQRAEHMKKGLCFRCHQPGHRFNECGQGPSNPRPPLRNNPDPPPKYTKATDAYTRIKAIYHDLPEDEKARLTNELENEGF